MKNIFFTMVMLLFCMVISCNHEKNDDAGSVPTIDLLRNEGIGNSDALAVNNMTLTQLASDTNEVSFMNATIIDVVGDTVILLDGNPDASRLVMFDLRNGNYLGQVNHRGEGPGEYRMILGAFVNGADGSVLIPNFDTEWVYSYSLADDSLLSTIEREPVKTMVPPIGGVETCINAAVQLPDGLTIDQYNSEYEKVDSIFIPGFIEGNFNMVWENAGNNGVFMIADTLYALAPGELQKLAVLSRGDKALTNKEDEKISEAVIMNNADEKELLKPYILVRNVQYTDGKMLLTTMYNGVKHSDLYDMTNGDMLYRSTYDTLSKPNCVVVKDDSGKSIEVERLFAKDGKWYGLLNESENESPEEAKNVIISFEM